ncbi:MAG: LysR family transcriptional regulator [Clostridiaceae bacterium]
MNLDNVKCFISLAECLNFTKAAEKEHMTQTSMSRKISGLEEESGYGSFIATIIR